MLSLKWLIHLEDNVRLCFIHHGEDEQIWTFTRLMNTQWGTGKGAEEEPVYVKQTCTVKYCRGVLNNANWHDGGVNGAVSVDWEIVFTERLGVREAWGVDVSPESKFFIELRYEKCATSVPPDQLKLVEGRRRREVWEGESALMAIGCFPLKAEEVIVPELGYKVPYADEHGGFGYFKFPVRMNRWSDEEQLWG